MRYVTIAVLAAATLLVPHSAEADVTAHEAWVRMPPPVAETAALYVELRNDGNASVRLRGASCDASARVEFHDMAMQNGVMRMRRMEHVVIPAGGSLAFAPGGRHVMLVDLDHPLDAGEAVRLTLRFDDGSTLEVTAEVRDMRKRAPGDMDDHGGMPGMGH